jgi:hypothetical protein
LISQSTTSYEVISGVYCHGAESRAQWLPGVEMEVIGGVKQVVEAAEVFLTATTAWEPVV